jgi:hypothetical protein
MLANLIQIEFGEYNYVRTGSSYHTVDVNKLYDFLYENDYPAWLCNAIKRTYSPVGTRELKEFIMKLHTGESQFEVTKDWNWDQRELLGQNYIKDLCEDVLKYYTLNEPPEYGTDSMKSLIQSLKESLELDGYIYKDSRLAFSESDVFDATEEKGILQITFESLGLGDKDTTFHHLKLSEEHYLEHRWDDSISNSRKFLECVLREVAIAFSKKIRKVDLSESVASKPVQVREYLLKEGLLEVKEKEAIASVYSLLSETGGHPYMAQNEQARLLRHLALTFSLFVLLRFQGYLSNETK